MSIETPSTGTKDDGEVYGPSLPLKISVGGEVKEGVITGSGELKVVFSEGNEAGVSAEYSTENEVTLVLEGQATIHASDDLEMVISGGGGVKGKKVGDELEKELIAEGKIELTIYKNVAAEFGMKYGATSGIEAEAKVVYTIKF